MTRRAWLMLAWGILILTIVDGTNFFNIPPYSVNENSQSNSEANYEQEGFDGPVLSILIKLFDSIEGFIDRHDTLLTVLSAFAVAAFTGTLWWVTFGLFTMAKQQAADTRESLDISKVSADAAQKSAHVAEVALIIGQRAYVSAISSKIKNINSAIPVEATVTVKNSGNTPAHDVAIKTCIAFVDFFPGQHLPESRQDATTALIPPGGTVASTISGNVITQLEFQGLTDRVKALYVYGSIHYIDVFSKKCVSEFRFICGGDQGGVRDGEMHLCPDGNKADYDVKG